MGYVKRKGTTKANTQLPEDKFQRIKPSFLHQTVALVNNKLFHLNLIIYLDKTGIKLVPVGDWPWLQMGVES